MTIIKSLFETMKVITKVIDIVKYIGLNQVSWWPFDGPALISLIYWKVIGFTICRLKKSDKTF